MIEDVSQTSEYTIQVKTDKGTNNLSNLVNRECTLSGFNSNYFVVSCAGITIRVYRENGTSVTTIQNAIYPNSSPEPRFVSNVTEKYIIVKYKKSNRKDLYDFTGKYIRCEDC